MKAGGGERGAAWKIEPLICRCLGESRPGCPSSRGSGRPRHPTGWAKQVVAPGLLPAPGCQGLSGRGGVERDIYSVVLCWGWAAAPVRWRAWVFGAAPRGGGVWQAGVQISQWWGQGSAVGWPMSCWAEPWALHWCLGSWAGGNVWGTAPDPDGCSPKQCPGLARHRGALLLARSTAVCSEDVLLSFLWAQQIVVHSKFKYLLNTN